MIEATNLTKHYRDRVAIDHLNFKVEAGEILGFLGPNGAGKTTTMRILTGFLPPSEGSAKVAGFDVFEQHLEVKRRVGYLPENPPVYGDMTVSGYLKFCARIKQVPGSKLHDEVDRVANITGIAPEMDRLINNLSKGYKQRVGMAMALLNDPPVLILDEPTIGLDPMQIREVRSLIKGLAGKHTVILCTHILPEVEMTCNRILVIARGKVQDLDTLDALKRKHAAATLEEVFLKLVQAPSGSPAAAGAPKIAAAG
jgi:ABC-2 type transport system ATP-binding protein